MKQKPIQKKYTAIFVLLLITLGISITLLCVYHGNHKQFWTLCIVALVSFGLLTFGVYQFYQDTKELVKEKIKSSRQELIHSRIEKLIELKKNDGVKDKTDLEKLIGENIRKLYDGQAPDEILHEEKAPEEKLNEEKASEA